MGVDERTVVEAPAQGALGALGTAGTPAGTPVRAGAGRSRRGVLGAGAGGLGAVALAACGRGSRGDGAVETPSEAAVSLSYLHTWTPQQGHGPATDELVARFNGQSPSTQVTASGGQGGEAYYTKLTALLAGGDLPDVVSSGVEYLPFMVSRRAVVSPEALSKGPYRLDKGDLVPVSRDFATFDGKVMAMPYILSSQGVVFNQTLFRQRGLDPNKPPATWTDLVEMGKRLSGGSEDAETWGLQLPRGMPAHAPFLSLLWQNGGEVLDLTKRAITWNSPAGVEALQFWVDLVHRHRVGALEQPANVFRLGRAALWQLPVGSVSIVERSVGTEFEWSTAPVWRGKQAAAGVGGHTLSVMQAGKLHDRAWRFVHWFTSPATVVDFNVPSVTLPPWRSAQQQPAWQRYVKEQPRLQPFVDALQHGRASAKLATWDEIVRHLGGAVEAAVTQQRPPKAALDDAARAAEPLVRQE